MAPLYGAAIEQGIESEPGVERDEEGAVVPLHFGSQA